MTPETLRKACELAGLQHSVPSDIWNCWWIAGEPQSFGLGDDHPALLPLVAWRLTELRFGQRDIERMIIDDLVALGEMTLEQAKAELDG